MSVLTITPDRQALLRRLERTAGEYTNISSENGAFLHWLARVAGATRIVEVGTSNGYSGIYFGMAVEPRAGRVVTIEKDPDRAAEARRNLDEAGLSSVVEVRQGDALEILDRLEGEWDLAFLDAEKEEYRRYAESVVGRIRPGGVIVADDTLSLRHAMTEFVEWAYSAREVETCELPIDDGLILCRKRP